MYVWSKRLAIGLILAFILFWGLFFVQGQGEGTSVLQRHTTQWIIVNYVGLLIWLFVWMIDQSRVRGKNVWLWLGPFVVAPLPTLMALILFLQRRVKM